MTFLPARHLNPKGFLKGSTLNQENWPVAIDVSVQMECGVTEKTARTVHPFSPVFHLIFSTQRSLLCWVIGDLFLSSTVDSGGWRNRSCSAFLDELKIWVLKALLDVPLSIMTFFFFLFWLESAMCFVLLRQLCPREVMRWLCLLKKHLALGFVGVREKSVDFWPQ